MVKKMMLKLLTLLLVLWCFLVVSGSDVCVKEIDCNSWVGQNHSTMTCDQIRGYGSISPACKKVTFYTLHLMGKRLTELKQAQIVYQLPTKCYFDMVESNLDVFNEVWNEFTGKDDSKRTFMARYGTEFCRNKEAFQKSTDFYSFLEERCKFHGSFGNEAPRKNSILLFCLFVSLIVPFICSIFLG